MSALKVNRLDFKSLFIVFFAFTGNAQFLGQDLVLLCFFPFLFFLFLKGQQSILYQYSYLYFFMLMLLIFATFLAIKIDIPYFENYILWAPKAAILMTVIGFSKPPRWNMSNMFVFSLMIFLLIITGSIQDGRLFSVFGPNMLYRIFGMLVLFSVMHRFQQNHKVSVVNLLFIGLGIYGIILTGSAGGILVLFLVLLIYTVHFLKRSTPFYGILIVLPIIGLFALSIYFLTTFEELTTFSRISYKLAGLQLSSRFIGLVTLFNAPFSWMGYSYGYFGHLWFFGYEYPHNIFAELYAFYGSIGLFLIAVICSALSKIYVSSLADDVYLLTFAVLLVGACLSGDLSDNYGVIGIAGGLLIRQQRH